MRALFRVYLVKPQIIRMSHRAILLKFLNVLLTDGLQISLGVIVGLKGSGDFLGIIMQFFMSAVMTVSISQYYLVMLFIRTQYLMLNSELRGLIEETRALSYRPRRNGVMTKCCELSDRLDDIAQQQAEIQSLVISTENAFGVQGLFMYIGIRPISADYMTTI
ncbi:putative gustatory receptor 36c [Drosophila ananassae]|uniref:putative gustatory receptor 36c n=1 Tax=Drosophila ananassae TaxID=7217 RepID=UPI001CFF5897|nr:putative gustatory receptor 36c [Drosophila ananassae]